MSRKKKAKHRHQSGYNRHHLIWPRAEHNKGCSLLLRRAFVYELPIEVHNQLHATAQPVPPLNADEARQLWQEFREVDHEMNLFEALDWLRLHAPTSEFAIAIMAQQGFLQNNL